MLSNTSGGQISACLKVEQVHLQSKGNNNGILQMYSDLFNSIFGVINTNNVVNHKVWVFREKFNIRIISYAEKMYTRLLQRGIGNI